MKKNLSYLYLARLSGVILTFAVSLPSAFAQPAPQLGGIYPRGFQRDGAPHSITLYGNDFDGTSEVLVERAGVTAEIESVNTGQVGVHFSGGGVTGNVPEGHSVTVKITAPVDTTLDPIALRVVTPHGVSNAQTVLLGDLPEQYEAEPNATPDEAMKLDLPVTINGVVSSVDDEDYYQFEAKKGQRIFAEVNASRNGSALDSYLQLFGAQGEELARNDIHFGLDSLIDYEIEENGVYRLSIRDLRYRGGSNYYYRLSIGELPYLDSIYPLGGQRGTESSLALDGKNLGGVGSVQFSISPDAPQGVRQVRLTTRSGLSTNPLPFAVSDLPVAMETEPNNNAEVPPLNLPITVNGKIDPEEDVDQYPFNAKNGQRFIFEIFASRLGTRLDALLTLTDESGGVLARNDDAVANEARIDYTFRKDGKYIIALRDLSDRGGSEYAYLLRIAPPQPDFGASVSPENPRLTQGGSTALTLNVNRADGFSGGIRFEFFNLPHGVTAGPAVVDERQGQTITTLNADNSVAPGLYRIYAKAYGSNGSTMEERYAGPNPIYLTVTGAPKYRLETVTVGADVMQERSTQIHVKATRSPGFSQPIRLSVQGLPENVNANNPTIGAGQDEASIRIGADDDAAVGTFALAVRGEASENNQPVEQYTGTVSLSVTEAPYTLSLTPNRFILPLPEIKDATAVPRTEEIELTVSAQRKGLFTDDIEITAENVPEKMTVTTGTIMKGESELVVKISAEGDIAAETFDIRFTGKANANNRAFTMNAGTVSVKFIKAGVE